MMTRSSAAQSRFRVSRRLTLIIPVVILSACNTQDAPAPANVEADGVPVVYTVNYPLAYFTERITGDSATVVFPAPLNVDPAYWRPEASVISEFQQADLILLNGADYAKWTAMATLPESRLVDTSADVADQYIEVADAIVHQHGPEGEHSHAGLAFTTWLDPSLAIIQVSATQDALLKFLPDQQASINENAAALIADLEALDEELVVAFREFHDEPILFSHPVYQYLERRYSLNSKSVHWEPDQVPDAEEWGKFEAIMQEHPAKLMLWEGEPNPQTVARLESLGIRSVTFSPCANTPESGDFLSVMRENRRRLTEVAE